MSTSTYDVTVDSRLVFKVYAIVAWTAGALLYGWGTPLFPLPLAGLPYAGGFVARVSGAALLGAGFLAIAMARTLDEDGRRRALGWWAVGHVVVLAGVSVQSDLGRGLRSPRLGQRPGTWMAGRRILPLFGISGLRRTASHGAGWRTSITIPCCRSRASRTSGGFDRPTRSRSGRLRARRSGTGWRATSTIRSSSRSSSCTPPRRRPRHGSIPTRAGARAAIDQVRNAAREAMAEMEAMLDQLRASPLENTGLIEALKKQCDALRFRTGADVRLVGRRSPPERDASGRRAAGASSGSRRRRSPISGATPGRSRWTVTLDSSPISVQLRVDDDGVGFDTALPPVRHGPRQHALAGRGAWRVAGGDQRARQGHAGSGLGSPRAIETVGHDVARLPAPRIFWGAVSLFWLRGLPSGCLHRDQRGISPCWASFMVVHLLGHGCRVAVGYRRARRIHLDSGEGAVTA